MSPVPAESGFELPAGEVHVWRFGLDPPPDTLAPLESTLCAPERARADRFRTETLRRRFIAGRGNLRAILGSYVDLPAGQIAFGYGTHGKPWLVGASGLDFNLAHSHGVALCAVTRGGAVGVDIEAARPLESAERIIRRFFSPAECAAFLGLPEAERPAAFFRAWARKEAFLKATGTGLSTALDSFDVTLGPGEPAALLRVGDDPAECARWWLRDLDAGPGFAAALVAARQVTEPLVRLRSWDDRDHSYRRASIGSSREAFHAG
jgi:4'-phosphopantetheinyl transferase